MNAMRLKDEYRFHTETIDPAGRLPGISGFMRLRNEEEYLGPVIESSIPFLDELVIVYNRCTDRTPRIIDACRQRYAGKIQVYEYKPYVFPPRSREHRYLDPGSPHSLVNYCNYALSRTTRAYAIKLDGDEHAIPAFFERETARIRKEGIDDFATYYSINLWDENGTIFVNKRRPFKRETHGFFPVRKDTYFVHAPTWEEFSLNREECKTERVLFFHLKGMKKDRGLGNTGDRDHFLSKPYLSHPGLMTWSEFKKKYDTDDTIPSPEEIGIRPAREACSR
jgi:glycosyltransferase involved in cell wall biosynthesis